ncbi:MAG: YmdB family metallophosphoesterase [Lentisphaeria bacterium]|nr:YmdB family metallophosphoesterase [Lentisphaeria bacterium]
MSEEGPLLKILFIGDVVGKGGRNAVKKLVPVLKDRYHASFVIVNAENSANGSGISRTCIDDMNTAPVDVYTSGDHIWDQKNFEHEITTLPNVLRPANGSALQPGKGYGVFRNPAGGEVAVISLMGRVFMRESASCPFECAEKILQALPKTVKTVFVDFHGEATSEKAALAWMLDGKVTAVVGTHTHVQTADGRILPGGTAFLSDAGMTGSHDSVLGRKVGDVVKKFRTGMSARLEVAEEKIRMDYCVVTYELLSGRAVEIVSASEFYCPEEP